MQKQKFEEKKGIELGQAFNAVLIVSLVAILIVAVIYMFTALQTIAPNVSQTVSNEVLVITTGGTAVANSTDCGFGSFSVVTVTNSSGYLLNTGNYTTAAIGTIANKTSMAAYGTSMLTNYTYTNKGQTCVAADTFTTNFSNQIPLVGLVLTIVLIAIVIGVLVTSFFMRGSRV